MASNEAVPVENAVSKLHHLQFITIGISLFLNEHFQLVQFHLEPSILPCFKPFFASKLTNYNRVDLGRLGV